MATNVSPNPLSMYYPSNKQHSHFLLPSIAQIHLRLTSLLILTDNTTLVSQCAKSADRRTTNVPYIKQMNDCITLIFCVVDSSNVWTTNSVLAVSCCVGTLLFEVEATHFVQTLVQLFFVCFRAHTVLLPHMVPLFTPSLIWKGEQKVMKRVSLPETTDVSPKLTAKLKK